MKRILNMAAITALLVLTASLRNTAAAQDDDYYNNDEYYDDGNRGDVSYQTFYDELSPHGRWVDNPEYGYVWVPNAGRDFRPYSTNGHWVYTNNYEWMWVSDYSWGWAPFHYGRWYHDPFYGWVWVPGYEWSPAWVVWRGGGDYYGWAPIRPGISISINIGFGGYSPPHDYWIFAPRRYITSPRLYNYCYDRGRNVTIINHTTIINNYNYGGRVWRTGPSRYEAERYTGRITPVRFRESARPGRTQFRNNEVSVYRPRVQQDNTRRFSPRNVERYEGRTGDNNVSTNNDARTNRRFERPGSMDRTNNDVTRRNENGNGNRPIARERSFEPRNSDQPSGDVRQRGFERRNADRTSESPDRQPQRGFERRNTDRTTEAPVRQRREVGNRPETRPQMERQPQSQPRQLERRNVERPSQGNTDQRREMRTMERPQQQPQAQPQQRQFERRSESGSVQQRQERRSESGNTQQREGNGNGNGNGNGKGRRF
jgi:hypothetical protein